MLFYKLHIQKNKLSTFKILVTYAFMLLAEDTKKISLGLS